jgi:D-glycero-beta-D-manno-heptose 1-phosphate adenylyltransferase
MKNVSSPRVMSWSEIQIWREAERAQGRTVVLTNGCFDLLHRGHLEYLQRSAALGDRLVVAVNSDASVRALKGPTRPVNNEQDRAFALASLRCVDVAFIFPGPRLAGEITGLRPDIYTKAGDYTVETLEPTERSALLAGGVDIQILPFVAGHSTTATIKRLAE